MKGNMKMGWNMGMENIDFKMEEFLRAIGSTVR